MINRWRTIALISLFGSMAVLVILFESHRFSNYRDVQVFTTAFILACTIFMLLPFTIFQQKTTSGMGKVWCILVGPFWFCCGIVLWWILGKISATGDFATRIVDWLFPIGICLNLILTIRHQQTMLTNQGLYPNPYNRHQCIALGEGYLELGQYQKAIDEYTVAIDQDPNDGEMYWRRAKIYEKLDMHDLAEKDEKLSTKLGYKLEN